MEGQYGWEEGELLLGVPLEQVGAVATQWPRNDPIPNPKCMLQSLQEGTRGAIEMLIE